MLDVLVVGDGPAGLALAAACAKRGLSVAVLGPGQSWTATYATWVDDVRDLPYRCFASISPSVVVHARRRHVLDRPYGVLDGAALADHLGRGVQRRTGTARTIQHFAWGSRVCGEADLDARLVVDASGRSTPWSGAGRARRPAAWQTAYGVVVDAPPIRFDEDLVTFMDLRIPPGDAERSTFCYVVPVEDGWLVEETALAARPAVDPAWLRDRLAMRLGAEGVTVDEAARRVEAVVIPMGGRLPSRRDPVVRFGAAAGYTNPVTGFSVAAALRAAPRVADAIAAALAVPASGRPNVRPVHDAVWPRSARRTRRLHDHGLEVLLRLAPTELAEFFDAFFDLPIGLWSAYLRIDSPPGDVSRAMTGVLRGLPWRVRRRVLATPPVRRRRGET
ncbi:MAG: lycopene cyclase family protein [Ilumatobacteraceae bacterium]